MTPLYTATATATGGREGTSRTEDGKINVKLTIPKELGGPGGDGTDPEALFATGYAACFTGALRLVAGKMKVNLGPDTKVTAKVTIGKNEQGGYGLAVELTGHLPSLPRAQAQELMNAAHGVCPYSLATKGNIPVKVDVAG